MIFSVAKVSQNAFIILWELVSYSSIYKPKNRKKHKTEKNIKTGKKQIRFDKNCNFVIIIEVVIIYFLRKMATLQFYSDLSDEISRIAAYAASLSDTELEKSLQFAWKLDNIGTGANECANCNEETFCMNCEFAQARRQVLAREFDKRKGVEYTSMLSEKSDRIAQSIE